MKILTGGFAASPCRLFSPHTAFAPYKRVCAASTDGGCATKYFGYKNSVQFIEQMKRLEIIRLEALGECIRGVARLDGELLCCTLERPWADNRRNVSAIPAGIYKAEPRNSPKFGDVFEILNVPGRTDILIHAGNTAEDTRGCVLVGRQFGELQRRPAVLSSKGALEDLKMQLAGEKLFTVEIREAFE